MARILRRFSILRQEVDFTQHWSSSGCTLHPKIRRGLALLGELDHVDGRGCIALSAPPHRTAFCHNRPVMSFHCEHRSDAEHDQNPNDEAGIPKESVDHGCTPLLKTVYNCSNGNQSRQMERCHERHFDRFDPPSYGYPRSKYGPRKATNRWRKAARSSEAERARWVQVRRNGQGDKALGWRLHGVRAENDDYRRRYGSKAAV